MFNHYRQINLIFNGLMLWLFCIIKVSAFEFFTGEHLSLNTGHWNCSTSCHHLVSLNHIFFHFLFSFSFSVNISKNILTKQSKHAWNMVCATIENPHPIHAQATSLLKSSRIMPYVVGCQSWLHLYTDSLEVRNLSWLVWWVFLLFYFCLLFLHFLWKEQMNMKWFLY